MNSTEDTPAASVPGSKQGHEPKPEHTISGPDGVTLTPDSQAARRHVQSSEVPSPAGSGPATRSADVVEEEVEIEAEEIDFVEKDSDDSDEDDSDEDDGED